MIISQYIMFILTSKLQSEIAPAEQALSPLKYLGADIYVPPNEQHTLPNSLIHRHLSLSRMWAHLRH